MIASIAFKNFKALRDTRVALSRFNLVIGPNGSGKTSLIAAVRQLGGLAKITPHPLLPERPPEGTRAIAFTFTAPFAAISAQLSCVSDTACEVVQVSPADAPSWPALRSELTTIRSYLLDHNALGQPSLHTGHAPLSENGANLSAVLADLQDRAPSAFSALTSEILRILPEFNSLKITPLPSGQVEAGLSLTNHQLIPASELSQGTLYLLGILALAFDPCPPHVLCIEEVDRGIHPRLLRPIRDALYRLSHPESVGSPHRPTQIITTTHSPYFIDLFRDHPEDVILSEKQGNTARFMRLADRPDLPELLHDGSLGDMWFSGILGGVPEEP